MPVSDMLLLIGKNTNIVLYSYHLDTKKYDLKGWYEAELLEDGPLSVAASDHTV